MSAITDYFRSLRDNRRERKLDRHIADVIDAHDRADAERGRRWRRARPAADQTTAADEVRVVEHSSPEAAAMRAATRARHEAEAQAWLDARDQAARDMGFHDAAEAATAGRDMPVDEYERLSDDDPRYSGPRDLDDGPDYGYEDESPTAEQIRQEEETVALLAARDEAAQMYGGTKTGVAVDDDADEPETDGPSAAQEEAWDAREDDARGHALNGDGADDDWFSSGADAAHQDDLDARGHVNADVDNEAATDDAADRGTADADAAAADPWGDYESHLPPPPGLAPAARDAGEEAMEAHLGDELGATFHNHSAVENRAPGRDSDAWQGRYAGVTSGGQPVDERDAAEDDTDPDGDDDGPGGGQAADDDAPADTGRDSTAWQGRYAGASREAATDDAVAAADDAADLAAAADRRRATDHDDDDDSDHASAYDGEVDAA